MNIITRFYDTPPLRFIYKNMGYFLDHPLRRKFNNPNKIVKSAEICRGMKVLEVGCGSGYFTIPAAQLVGKDGCIHAIDIHPIAIETVSKKILQTDLKNIKCSVTDALNTGLPSESYDMILLLGVIPAPVLPMNKLLPEMHRLLIPGGSLAVWTGIPFWSHRAITNSGLFLHIGK